MIIPQNLTPLSKSFLHSTLDISLRRAATQLQLADLTPAHDLNTCWAAMTNALWGTAPEEIGHLLAVQAPANVAPGKSSRGLKIGQQVLPHFAAAYQRVQDWHNAVATAEWSQAQLLQVMEEVEPQTIDVLTWLHITAVMAVGSYAYVGELIAKFEKDATRARALRLGLCAGLPTPEAALLQTLKDEATSQTLQKSFGHLPLQNSFELAQPRLQESPTAWLQASAPAPGAWQPVRARTRRKSATAEARSRTRFLARSALQKGITLLQEALLAHAQARDALHFAMATTRLWAHAAAAEGLSDGRLLHLEEIFWLEIEEIKQLMTGEWANRERIAPLLAQRKAEPAPQPASTPSRHPQALGVAGAVVSAGLYTATAPDAILPTTPFVAQAATWHPQWWRIFLGAQGILEQQGNLLSWGASAARAGDLAAIVNSAQGAEKQTMTLKPAQNQTTQQN